MGGVAEGRAEIIASRVSVENNRASYSEPCRTTSVDTLALLANLNLTHGIFNFSSYHFPPPPSLFFPHLCFQRCSGLAHISKPLLLWENEMSVFHPH